MTLHALASFAVPHEGRLGRVHDDPPDAHRNPFQRDRDRIIHSQAFRRMQGKTQVFEVGEGDHFRTRLTHTLEVAQVSRDLARRLKLNEDLAECLALSHDLGHPPFGHGGEDALDAWLQKRGSHFEHNEQSLRLVTVLEGHSKLYRGLNLNQEVLEGLQKHSKLKNPDGTPRGHSLEAQLVNMCDEIAYTAHDTDDGIRADFFSLAEAAEIPLVKDALALAGVRGTQVRGSILHILTDDLAAETEKRLAEKKIQTMHDVYASSEDLVDLSPVMRTALKPLRQFLNTRMYEHPHIAKLRSEGQAIITKICDANEQTPSEHVLDLQKRFDLTLIDAIKDYVAGMTDAYARGQVRS